MMSCNNNYTNKTLTTTSRIAWVDKLISNILYYILQTCLTLNEIVVRDIFAIFTWHYTHCN